MSILSKTQRLQASVQADPTLPSGPTQTLVDPRTPAELLTATTPAVLNGRYELIAQIGAGGFGDVYRARDRHQGIDVAVKLLRHASTDAIDRFKREFRFLQGLTHPGLVALHELGIADGRWFYAMELLDGVDFLTWVRNGVVCEEVDPEAALATRREPACDLDRLWRAAAALAQTLSYVHAIRHVHRDVKPSNVMVTTDGRVILLDFGLVKSGDRGSNHDALHAYGTPRYLAPEQARGRSGHTACDWYALGTMLWEAICGRPPFVGGAKRVIELKLRTDAPPAGLIVEKLDPEIDRFIGRLLSRDPVRRPQGAEIVAWLAARAPRGSGSSVSAPQSPTAQSNTFVGRHAEINQLIALFAACAAQRAERVLVRGPSGIGKSALIDQFLNILEFDHGALVLRSRCFECETVPYKAFEGLIDELRVLVTAWELFAPPPGFDALLRLFPQLAVSAMSPGSRDLDNIDPPELRRRGVEALCSLLETLAAGRPVVLWFDDLQWGDAESALLLDELNRRWPRPGCLTVLSYRPDPSEYSDCVPHVEAQSRGAARMDIHALPVGEGAELFRSVTGAEVDASDPTVRRLLEEAAGNPFLISELAGFVAQRGPLGPAPISVRDMLTASLQSLPTEATRLLRTLCVASSPLDEATALRATQINDPTRTALRTLLSARRLRRVGVGGADLIAWHDRIREEVLSQLEPDELAATHLAIARAMQELGRGEPETLLEHLQAAGELGQAAQYAVAAARRAAGALAFDRAARLFWSALDLLPQDDPEHAQLRYERATALAFRGRGGEAAAEFLAVAATSAGERRSECERRAAEQLLRSGHLDDGIALAGQLLGRVGVWVAPNSPLANAEVIARRGWLRVRGLRHVSRRAEDVDRATLERIDLTHNLSVSLGLTDPVRGLALHSRSVQDALTAGEPHRLSRALAFDAAYHALVFGTRDQAWTARVRGMARLLAAPLADPYIEGVLDITGATVAWTAGQWSLCEQRAHSGIERLQAHHPGAVWEIGFGRTHWLDALAWQGKWRRMAEALELLLADAVARGDLHAETLLRVRFASTAGLAADTPEVSRASLRAIDRWSQAGVHVEHLVVAFQTVEIALYEGDAERAWTDCLGAWPDLERSGLLRMQPYQIQLRHLRARAALARAVQEPGDRAVWVRQARVDIAALQAQRSPFASALADALAPGVAMATATPGDVAALLERAARVCADAELHMHAAAAQFYLGRMEGGTRHDAGRLADDFFAEQGVTYPRGVARALLPGLEGLA